jgi:hypothetical protein
MVWSDLVSKRATIWGERVGNVARVTEETYRGADKSLARPGRKQATATEDFDVHISYLQS